MYQEYLKLIAELDRVLSFIRQLWLEGRTAEEKAGFRVRIDQLLDERSRMMRARDAALASMPASSTAA